VRGETVNKYTRLFIEETRAYLDTIVRALPDAPGQKKGDLAEACRLAHSIKGMALFEEQSAVAGLAYALEQGIEALDSAGAEGELLFHLAGGVDLLRLMIDEVERQGFSKEDPTSMVEAIVRGIG
jgi:chemotaxis protein histidine kinase CheA